MAISQIDRKLLWARSHNRCALCRRLLTSRADTEDRPGLVLGQEAHIVARNPAGPRGSERSGVRIDAYDNLVLLCPEDHKRVDEQPTTFGVERLRALKSEHERWAEDSHAEGQTPPVRVIVGVNEDSIPFDPITTGRQLWELVAGSHEWSLSTLGEEHSDSEIDIADRFLQTAQDWGEVASEVESEGLQAVREAQRNLTDELKELWAAGIYAWGRRLRRTITGGIGQPMTWWSTQLVARMPEDLEEARGEEIRDADPAG
ncbi:HNH endonuclease [Amnibacterium kyonggiense]|uniref:HNH endonuclease n=1 Tax=Amnibacterium kyonggiense TaxID=595671 RepID=UPI001060EEBC|nr:HNH endonuclease signature motif containing protein [Amnibacterium kyonggiense]